MQPSRSRPAQPAGGPAHLAPPPLSSSSPTGGRRVPDARAPPRLHLLLPLATSCFLLVAWNAPDDATQPRPPSHSLPNSSPSSAPSPSRARAQPQPRHRNAAATVSPSTPRCACELRLNVPDLLDKPRRHGRAATPPSPLSSSPWPENRRRSIRSNEDAPKLTNPFVRSTVSYCVDPLPSLALFLPLTPISTGAESSSPPAMSPP